MEMWRTWCVRYKKSLRISDDEIKHKAVAASPGGGLGANHRAFPVREGAGSVYSELTLGTAQLGMKYGIANRVGNPSRSAAVGLARQAIIHGVMHLDTARGYEESESVLGEALQDPWGARATVVTKLDPLTALSSTAEATIVCAAVDRSVATSCCELRLHS